MLIQTPVKAQPIRFKSVKARNLIAFSLLGRPVKFGQWSFEEQETRMATDTRRALARLELMDPAPTSIIGAPSMAAFNLAKHIYPDGVNYLLCVIDEESERRHKAEMMIMRRQMAALMLGSFGRATLPAGLILGALLVLINFGSAAGLAVALGGGGFYYWLIRRVLPARALAPAWPIVVEEGVETGAEFITEINPETPTPDDFYGSEAWGPVAHEPNQITERMAQV